MPDQIPPEVRAARREVTRLSGERAALLREGARLGAVDTARLAALDGRIAGALDGVLHLTDPCDASETEPVVLLPVRLETRYAQDGGAAVLRVRIYPDQIHLDDLPRGLTDEETAAGRTWWTAAWTDPVPDEAWASLVAGVGADRAEWVAAACTPTNLAERGGAPAPTFPSVLPRGPRAVTARGLPDRFVVKVVTNGRVLSATGAAIPRDLVMSPVPLDDDAVVPGAGGLVLPPGAEWLVDYEAAVAVGMAVTVSLPGGAVPIDRVVVIGTRASLTPSAAADELEDLLRGHRYWGGLGLLAQGTATNNTDESRSPYQPRRTPQPPSLVPASAATDSDATAAANVLGIDAATLASWVGAGPGEQTLARSVNTCLWAPGWGEYLARLEANKVPGITAAQREAARQLFAGEVRGRGVAPVLRVGDQPYGVLPVSDLRAWVPAAGESTGGVFRVVLALLERWLRATDGVARVRPGDPDVEGTLLEVLGHSPVQLGLRVRPVVSDDVSGAVISAMGRTDQEFRSERIATSAVLSGLLGPDASKAIIGSFHDQTRPLPLPLASERDPEFIAALLGDPQRILAVDSVLQALLVLAWRSADLDVARSAPATVLPTLVEHVELAPALRVAATGLMSRAETAAPDELAGMVAQLGSAGVSVGTDSVWAYQPIEAIDTSMAEVALAAPVGEVSRRLAGAALAGWFAAMGYRAQVRAEMGALAASSVSERDLAVAEALDCCSHRLDAWATAVVARRRADQVSRRGGPLARAARGLTLGAYGVVTDLTPRAATGRDGWILAPSPQHATAAGMLRSAHLSHLPAAAGPGPFGIDLSSARLAAATQLLDGVRAGQQLGALLGYRIERDLAEAGLARLQLSLRALAPLVARRLSDNDGADPASAAEAVAATNVVDGVLLLTRYPAGDAAAMARLRQSLDTPPANAYLDPGDWDPLTPAQMGTLQRVLAAAADTLDAIADVLLSESVLQFGAGNPHRAAAAMDVMSSGAAPADTLDVIEVPDRGERLSHRVIVLAAGDATAPGWNATRPRALAEPRLEAWAGAVLGDPARIVVADGARRITLAEAGLAALDLVHCTGLDDLERMLRRRIADLGQAALAVSAQPGWDPGQRALGQVVRVASTLRTTIAGATALLPADLARPGLGAPADHTAALAGAIPELLGRVTGLVAGLASAVVAAEPVVAALPEDGIVSDEAEVTPVSAAVEPLEAFGIPLAPSPDLPLDLLWARRAWETAQSRVLAGQAGLQQVVSSVTSPVAALEQLQDVASTVLGDAFVVVPLLDGPGALGQEAADPAFPQPPASAVRRFLTDLGTVRDQVRRASELFLLADALGSPRAPGVVQVGQRDALGAPAPGTDRWLAGPLPADALWPTGPVTHVVVDAVGTGLDGAVGGLVLDSWVEALPGQTRPGGDADVPRPDRATLGLAVRAESASARPPQVILSAVSPDGRRWTAERLRGVIECTLDLARIRMLSLHDLSGDGLVLPALYTRSSSLQGQPYLDFHHLAGLAGASVRVPFVKEAP